MPHEIRDQVVDFTVQWSDKTEIPVCRTASGVGIPSSKFYNWKRRCGKVNEHNAWIPRDTWLEYGEKGAIIDYYRKHPDEGYGRLTYMMLDDDVVAVSASSVYRVLKGAGLLRRWRGSPSGKGKGFQSQMRQSRQPKGPPPQHWHVDVAAINMRSTFYYLCRILDGYSRYIVDWDIRESMTEGDVEVIIQRAREKFPEARPRVISDNGPQFVAKAFIRMCGMTHVRTSPFYPQSNGKMERWHASLKQECIRPGTPLCLADARRLVNHFVEYYNNVRSKTWRSQLHSSIGYVASKDKLEGWEEAIFAQRDRKLEEARERRRVNRQRARSRDRDKHRVPKPTVEAVGTGGYKLTRMRRFSISR